MLAIDMMVTCLVCPTFTVTELSVKSYGMFVSECRWSPCYGDAVYTNVTFNIRL